MDEDNKKEYEIGFVVLEEDDAKKIAETLRLFGAEIVLEGPLQKVALGYRIRKATHGVFGYLHFWALTAKIKEINREFSVNTSILRFLIIQPPFLKPKKSAIRSGAELPKQNLPVEPKQPSVRLSNEALEKKLEEILQ